MKKLPCSVFTLLLAMICLVSCFDTQHPCGGVITEPLVMNGNYGVHTELEGFYMTLNSVGESSISVTWHNDTDISSFCTDTHSPSDSSISTEYPSPKMIS